MSAPAAAAAPALASLREQAGAWWRARAPRERQALAAVAAVLAFFIVWSVAVAPAWRTLQAAPKQIDQLDAQLEQMRRVAAEATGLRSTPPVSSAQAAAALKVATEALGDAARLTLQGDRATLSLTNVGAEPLRGWLQQARSAARVRPVEAQLQRSGSGYSGSLVVSFGAGT